MASLEDIWARDALRLLSSADERVGSIFDLEHVFEFEHKDLPDEVARRTQCDDFYRFESLFEEVRQELRSGGSETVQFQMKWGGASYGQAALSTPCRALSIMTSAPEWFTSCVR